MTSHAEAPPASSPAPDAPPPKKLGKYVIQKALGAGGMGTVYLATDRELNRTVALKVLPKERAKNPTLVKRFKSEGQAAARLEHENIVKVFEAGQINGQLYLALEYIDGIDVLELTRKRDVLPVRRSIEIIQQVAAALQHAADRNMVHRDIKPSNILIRKDGVVKLADMGLARAIDDTTDTNITRDGMTVGTVDYMSPEQARDSRAADIRSDLYSLGCSWYHMLTGQPPFAEGSVTSKLQAHATASPPDPRHINERVPEAIVAVIHRLMAKRPIDRYQTPAELIADLSQSHIGRAGMEAGLLAGLSEDHTDESAAASPTDEDVPQDPSQRKRSRRRGSSDQPTSKSSKAPRTARSKKRNPSGGDGDNRDGLPPRSANPAALGGSQRQIDPELIKFAFFGILGLTIIGLVGWGVMSLRLFDDNTVGSAGNPFATRNPNADDNPPHVSPQPVRPSGPPPSTSVASEDPEPTAEVRDFDRTDPFPGAERANIDDAIQDVPDWVYEARGQPLTALATFNVNSGSVSSEEFAAAVARLPRSGGIIEFVGRGPFAIDVSEISGPRRVVFRGAAGAQPVLLLGSSMELEGGQFEFHGVHIVAPGRELPTGLGLLQIASGTLLLRNSSVSVTDPSPNAVAAVQLTGRTAPGRCVLENCMIRGNNLTAVATQGPQTAVVAGNCLLSSGDAAVLSVSDPSPQDGTAASSEPAAAIDVRASVLMTRGNAFALSQAPGRALPTVALRTDDVVFCSVGGSSAAWMELNLWPEVPQGDTANPRAKGLDWTDRNSRWFGWNSLVRMAPPTGSEIAVASESEWVQFWRRPFDSRALLSSPAVEVPDDASRIDPSDLVSALETAFAESAVTAEVPIDARALPSVPKSIVERIQVVSGRPRLPSGFERGAGTNLVEFDLDKGRTLNRFLNSDACPDKSRVVLFGSGRKVIESVILKNKSLRLEFQSREKPLYIEPIPGVSDERPAAIFDVEGGRIDLVGAQIRIPASATRKYPLRVLRVTDGDFSLQNCRLQGQLRDGATDAPLIEWVQSSGGAFGLVENSFLIGRTTVLSGDVGGRLLEIRNCILLSQFDGLSLNSEANAQASHVVLKSCTVSVGRSAIVVEDVTDSPGINLFVDHTVFGPALDPIDGGPFVVTYPPGEEIADWLSWWENRNAFSSQIQTYRSLAGEDARRQDFQKDWLEAWGPDHVLDPLTGATAVLFRTPARSLEKALPEDFTLDPSATASKWGPDGGPIGARPAGVGPNASPEAAETPGRPRSNKPARTMPDF